MLLEPRFLNPNWNYSGLALGSTSAPSASALPTAQQSGGFNSFKSHPPDLAPSLRGVQISQTDVCACPDMADQLRRSDDIQMIFRFSQTGVRQGSDDIQVRSGVCQFNSYRVSDSC